MRPASAGFFLLSCSMFSCYDLSRALWHDLGVLTMATTPQSVDVLSSDERNLVAQGLKMLAASMRRAAKAAPSDDIRKIYERDADRVDSLMIKFR